MDNTRNIDDNTRVFFVVNSLADNEEIFETLGEARAHLKTLNPLNKPYIAVSYVNNAFRESDGTWNYTDSADTFMAIETVEKI